MLTGKNKFQARRALKIILPLFLLLMAFLIYNKITLAAPELIINEIMYDLPEADQGHEWVEIYNASTSEIDLAGWKINDGNDATNHALNLPPKNGSRGTITIKPEEYLLLADDATLVTADLPNYKGMIIDTVFSLSNSFATLSLINKEGQTIYVAYYSKSSTVGNGKSLEWDGTQFKGSLIQGGTPGLPNSVLEQNISIPSSTLPIQSSSPDQLATASGMKDLPAASVISATPLDQLKNTPVQKQSDNPTNTTISSNKTAEGQNTNQIEGAETPIVSWLLVLTSLSSLAAIALIYFKRQQQSLVDSKKSGDTID